MAGHVVPAEMPHLGLVLQRIAGEEARHRALIAALREPVITTALDGRVTGCNRAAERLFGDRLGAAIAIQDVLPFVQSPADAGECQTWRGSIDDARGTRTVDLEVSLAILTPGLTDPDGLQTGAAAMEQPLGAGIFVVHDISHFVELSRMREQLLYSVAHELRSPIAALSATLEVLEDEWDAPDRWHGRDLLASARRATGRLGMLMEDLLSAGSIQSGKFRTAPVDVPLRTLLDDALQFVEAHLRARGQRVVWGLEPVDPAGEVAVRVDPRYTRQVLTNLLLNASKYSPSGAAIEIAAEEEEQGWIRLTVADHGPGIPESQLAGLFERYYRASTGGEHGFGLGLAIARSIVEAHGGRIGIDSRVGEGTRVWLTLPRAVGGAGARSADDAAAAAGPS